MIDYERLSCQFIEIVHIRRETVVRGIEIQDNVITRGKWSKNWGICQVIDMAKLATTIHNTRDGNSMWRSL